MSESVPVNAEGPGSVESVSRAFSRSASAGELAVAIGNKRPVQEGGLMESMGS
jgi:hypothetical protein